MIYNFNWIIFLPPFPFSEYKGGLCSQLCYDRSGLLWRLVTLCKWLYSTGNRCVCEIRTQTVLLFLCLLSIKAGRMCIHYVEMVRSDVNLLISIVYAKQKYNKQSYHPLSLVNCPQFLLKCQMSGSFKSTTYTLTLFLLFLSGLIWARSRFEPSFRCQVWTLGDLTCTGARLLRNVPIRWLLWPSHEPCLVLI